MQLSDLVPGKHVIETKRGDKYLVCCFDNEKLFSISLTSSGWLDLSVFNEDLTYSNRHYTIVKVYTMKKIDQSFSSSSPEYLDLLWEKDVKYITKHEAETLLTELHPTKKI